MDSLEAFRNAIMETLERMSKRPQFPEKLRFEPVFDRERDRYLLVLNGWNGSRQLTGLLVHAEIINGKIWIYHDDTKEVLATQLVNAGVPKDRIVLGFWPESVRRDGEFAAN